MHSTWLVNHIRDLCERGGPDDVDAVVGMLDSAADLPTTKVIDFYLGQIANPGGVARVEHHLFNGTQMQRNYCVLFFARRNEWEVVNRAYGEGLVDWMQAYSR